LNKSSRKNVNTHEMKRDFLDQNTHIVDDLNLEK